MTRSYLDIEDDLEFKNNKYNEISLVSKMYLTQDIRLSATDPELGKHEGQDSISESKEEANSGNRVEVEDHVGSTKFKTSPTSDLSVAAAEELADHLKVDVNIR